ncbi:hypothetical protein ACFOD9_07005 [Novosphingobium bradum]|uniref:Uncharacterized protein n=1 Tax=Novosphingobium bradum TaxID=1737444 RepID=A0ABV7IT40_9SPHN
MAVRDPGAEIPGDCFPRKGRALLKEADLVTLTYRQLAEELGISLVAARTRVRRAVAAGRWRVVPGNRPGAPSYIQMPEREMADLMRDAHKTPTAALSGPDGPAENRQGEAAREELVIDTLRSAYRHIERLHRIALSEKDERRAIELRLVAAERTNQHLRAEVDKLEDWVRQLDGQLTREGGEKSQLLVQIAQFRTNERQYHHRGLELQSRVERLRRQLREARRPIWRKLFYRAAD